MFLSRFELRRFRGFLPKLALLFACLVPVIYGSIYLAANWDPYSRMKDLPVAIVNEDVTVPFNGQSVHAGKDLTDNLVASRSFDWHVTDAADAEAGLREGRYYLTVDVPADFSQNLVSGSTNDPKRAEITLRRNDANGFVIGSVTGSAQDKITEAVNQTAVKSYFEAVFSNLQKIREGMISARDGSTQLATGIASAKTGSAQLATGAAQASTATHKLATGTSELNAKFPELQTGATQLQTGLGELSTGSMKLYDGATQVAGGTQELTDTVLPVIDQAAALNGRVRSTSGQITTDVQGLAGDVATNSGSVGSRLTQVQSSLDALAQIPGVSSSQAYKDASARLALASERNAAVAQRAASVAATSAQLNQVVQTAPASTALKDAKAKLTALNSGAHQVATGAQSLHAGIDEASAGTGKLSTGIATAGGAVSQINTGLGQLDTGVASLSTGATSLDTGLGELSTGAQKLTKGLADGVNQIPALTQDQANGAAQVLSAPADVKSVVENPAKVYGRGLAPLFFSIAMWVFGISGFLVMRPISGRLLSGRMNPLRLTLSAYIPFGTVAVAGALVMLATVWIGLGLDPVHGLATLSMTVLVALVFSVIAHFLRMALGLPGSATLLVWLILQLASTGGTYPAAILPPFFQWIAPFMPISYSIEAFRISISGGLWSRFWADVVVLMVIGATTFVLDALVIRARQRFTMTDLHPPLQH